MKNYKAFFRCWISDLINNYSEDFTEEQIDLLLKFHQANVDLYQQITDEYDSYINNNEHTHSYTSTITKETTSTIARRKSTVSKRTLNDYAKIVSGTYTGAGYLAQKGKVIEEYAKIKVVILRIDNNNVNVDVFENGESYFSKTNKYQVMKKGKNTYVLSLDGISDALITIDNAGHLTYIHPKVNIDGEIYTLNLTANKK